MPNDRDSLGAFVHHREQVMKWDHDCANEHGNTCPPMEVVTDEEWFGPDGTPVTDPQQLALLRQKMEAQMEAEYVKVPVRVRQTVSAVSEAMIEMEVRAALLARCGDPAACLSEHLVDPTRAIFAALATGSWKIVGQEREYEITYQLGDDEISFHVAGGM